MTVPPEPDNRRAYIDLVKRTITNYAYLGGDTAFADFQCVDHYDTRAGNWTIDPLARPISLLRERQLDLVERSILTIEDHAVPGDLIEAGIWRGGVIILMRALLDAYGIGGRTVFAADSFAGIPKNTTFRHDPVDDWPDRWIAPIDEVRGNIARLGLLDDRIRFVEGFFADSLPLLSNERFALIRLDSDSYESVETSIDYLYPLLSTGGIIIIDDWHLLPCRFAVERYRARHGIEDTIRTRAGNAWWVKQQDYGRPATPPI